MFIDKDIAGNDLNVKLDAYLITINERLNSLSHENKLLKKRIKKLEEKNKERECVEDLEFSTKLYKID
ncbi:MAG: hypothetical protein ACYDDE_00635 [bacterium]